MAFEVLVMDLDGTLTNSEKKISPKTKEALFRIRREGITLVLASGRPTPGVMPIAEELDMQEQGGYILSYNGANIMRVDTGEVIYQNVIPSDLIHPLYQAALREQIGIISYQSDKIIAGTKTDEFMEKESAITHLPIYEVDNFPRYIDFPVNKCLMTAPGHVLEAVEPRMAEQFPELTIFRSEPYFLECMPKNVDKAYSLSRLLKYLGLTRKQMICCGDGFNDVSMIKFAGLGVAMENAQDAVKEVADYITASNDADGIIQVIETFIKPSADRELIYV